MAQSIVEFDQYLNRKTGREALSLKLGYILKIIRGELPYSEYGNPVQFFAFDNPDLKPYVEQSLARNGINASVVVTEKGRLQVIGVDIQYEGDI